MSICLKEVTGRVSDGIMKALGFVREEETEEEEEEEVEEEEAGAR
jgi:hypothetical protein